MKVDDIKEEFLNSGSNNFYGNLKHTIIQRELGMNLEGLERFLVLGIK